MIRNRINYQEVNEAIGFEKGEKPKGKSMTEPDQTLTIQQMLERSRNGEYVPQKQAQYEEYKENLNWPDVTKLTKIEAIETARELQEFITSQHEVLEKYARQQKEIANESQEGPDKADSEGSEA